MGVVLVLVLVAFVAVCVGRAAWKASGKLLPSRAPTTEREPRAAALEPAPTGPEQSEPGLAGRDGRAAAQFDRAAALDLTSLPSARFRIKRTFAYVPDRDRRSVGGSVYWLRREPNNSHDENAVAVWDRSRKVGYLSAAKARLVANELDRIGAAAYKVAGEPPQDGIQLFVMIPSIASIRALPRRTP